jgi:hypothetical protein
MRLLATRLPGSRQLLALIAILAIGPVSPARATVLTYTAVLNGANESPANASTGTGTCQVDYDNVANTLHVHADFTGLLGNTTASHIHCATAVAFAGTAGVATTTPTFAGFPNGVTAGTYDNVLDLGLATSFNPAFVTAHVNIAGAAAFLVQSLADGKAYWNVHSSLYGGGEIRGFLTLVNSTPAAQGTWGGLKSLYR